LQLQQFSPLSVLRGDHARYRLLRQKVFRFIHVSCGKPNRTAPHCRTISATVIRVRIVRKHPVDEPCTVSAVWKLLSDTLHCRNCLLWQIRKVFSVSFKACVTAQVITLLSVSDIHQWENQILCLKLEAWAYNTSNIFIYHKCYLLC